MKVLITGLCLQGNKGGPAIAFSLMNKLRKHIEDDLEFTFSVPSGEEFKYEVIASKKYDIQIVEDFSIKDIFYHKFPSSRNQLRRNRYAKWIQELLSSDLTIDMSGIAYTGRPVGTIKSVVMSPRLRHFIISQVFKKPFLAWTQSYGPLSPIIVRLLAWLDLSRQPIIFCRGEACLNEIRSIFPNKEIHSFPDVANILDYDLDWGRKYINSLFGDSEPNKLITISPSAVIYERLDTGNNPNVHICEIAEIIRNQIGKGGFVLLVPHTFRPGRIDPNICDYAVSMKILEQFQDLGNVKVVHEDLPPNNLKSIIGNAFIHVGARYHSIVASLSTGVPTISLSWHPKYEDIMRQYDVGEFVHETNPICKYDNLLEMIKKIEDNREAIKEKLIINYRKIENDIDHNSFMFTEMVKRLLP